MRDTLALSVLLTLAAPLACSGDKADTGSSGGHHDGGSDSGGAEGVATTIQFSAGAGDTPFSCTTPLTGLGLTATTWTPSDLRLYLHGFSLIDAAGEATPLILEQDGLWQVEDVVLLDFEDKTGTCSNGTTDRNDRVVGTAPAGEWTGLRFSVGVPFALNHGDAATAPSPLNLSSMFWGWEGGYKFVRIDGSSTGQPAVLTHIGSTGCVAGDDGEITDCAQENVSTLTIEGFDPAVNTLRLDLAGTDLDANADGTMGICMSEPSDPDCGPIFAALGIGFGGAAADPTAQTTFVVE
jgi:uncharacterized repeat protein (TIGR04052 family)